MKICTKCGVEKPESAYYLRHFPTGTVTLTAECRDCARARKRKYNREIWYPANREKHIKDALRRKTTSKEGDE